MKLTNNLDIWLQSIYLLSRKSFPIWDGVFLEAFCPKYIDKLIHLIEEGFDNEIISKDEYSAMDPTNMGPAKFYELFKVHKSHTPGVAPPERPIISASGSITENCTFCGKPDKRSSKQAFHLPARHARFSKNNRRD